MPFIKVTYSSPYNVSVEGSDYFEILDSDLDEDGSVRTAVLGEIWQEAVNDFMIDTYAELVDNQGD